MKETFLEDYEFASVMQYVFISKNVFFFMFARVVLGVKVRVGEMSLWGDMRGCFVRSTSIWKSNLTGRN